MMRIMGFLVALSFALSMPCVAALAADFDVAAPLTDLEGKPIKDGEAVLTAGRIAIVALVTSYPDEQGLSGDEKAKRFALAVKIQSAITNGKNPDLIPDDLSLIKKLVDKGMTPIVVGRMRELIDKKTEK